MLTLGFQEVFKAISDPTRREVLQMLKEKPLSAGEIVAHFDITGASISRHLSLLKDAGLVRNIKKGKYIYYEINLSVMEEVMTWIAAFMESDKSEGYKYENQD